MTNEEFSNNIDTRLSIFSNSTLHGDSTPRIEIVLDEYEKSVFLTMAEEDVAKSFYTGKNAYGESFEGTEEMRRYLSNLTEEALLDTPIKNANGLPYGMGAGSRFFTLPPDVWFITYEALKLNSPKAGCEDNPIVVTPVTQDEYHKVRKNPFRGVNNRRALRLDLADGVIEIVSSYDNFSYYLRYLKKPEPIILVDLPDGLTIGNLSERRECKLHEGLHQMILDKAVALAIESRGYSQPRQKD